MACIQTLPKPKFENLDRRAWLRPHQSQKPEFSITEPGQGLKQALNMVFRSQAQPKNVFKQFEMKVKF